MVDFLKNDIAVLSVPFDGNSSYLQGPAAGPARIHEALYCPSSNMWTEHGLDLGRSDCGYHFVDALNLDKKENPLSLIESRVAELLDGGHRVISLGGDHSITYPIIRAYAKAVPGLNILHFDAHPDLYDELNGNRHSHACPFARIMEEGLAARLVQIGIRTMTGHQRRQAARFGVEVIDMASLARAATLQFSGPIYLSLDLDCLDPAFAPGVSHHEPGGITTRELLAFIQRLDGELVGADIVEYNPERDLNGVTAMVAAKLLKEILGKMLV
jgi:arginase